MGAVAGHAVVLGAGMAGLLAARVLADTYSRVTVLERDPLPDGAGNRRGVPQGRHAHLLVPGGTEVLDRLLPGLLDELRTGGVPVIRDLAELRFAPVGRPLCLRGRPAEPFLCQASRPFLEDRVRARVRALPTVEMVERREVADLVTDATGRGSRTPAWLATMGYDRPPEEQLTIQLKYATRHLRRRPGALGG